MEAPAQFPGVNVVSADVARECGQCFGQAAAHNKKVFVNDCRTGQSDEAGGYVASEPFAEIDSAISSKRGDWLAGLGV